MDHYYKIIVYGKKGVGKTTLLNKINNNKFPNKPTIGIDSFFINKTISDERVKITFFDLSGDERFFDIIKKGGTFQGADGFIIVYDVTSYESFLIVKKFIKNIRNDFVNQSILLLGNKCDLQRNVLFSDVLGFAEVFKVFCLDVIKKENIEEIINKFILLVHNQSKDKKLNKLCKFQ